MNGRLDVESREGIGTRFIVRLPLAAVSDLLEQQNETGASGNTPKDSEVA